MSNILVRDGGTIEWTNGTGSDVDAGQPVDLTDRVGVALVDIANGAVGTVQCSGVFRLAKKSGTSFAQGADVDWDVSEEQCDELGEGESGDFLHIGKCMLAVTTEDYLHVEINVAITMTTVA